jgi:hypothetical protein
MEKTSALKTVVFIPSKHIKIFNTAIFFRKHGIDRILQKYFDAKQALLSVSRH